MGCVRVCSVGVKNVYTFDVEVYVYKDVSIWHNV
jgi:hypothetical protein